MIRAHRCRAATCALAIPVCVASFPPRECNDSEPTKAAVDDVHLMLILIFGGGNLELLPRWLWCSALRGHSAPQT